MAGLSLFKYPSNIVWIDDDNLFLKTIKRTFNKYYLVQVFNDPIIALNLLEKHIPFLSIQKFLRACKEHESYDNSINMPVDINTNDLSNIFLEDDRKNEISLIIVDYKMPGINGVELCRHLKKFPMKKILLTGEADNQEAVKAFNEGIIDRYVRKDSPELMNILREYMDILIEQYFHECTMPLLSHLEAENPLPISDPVFIDYFKFFCKKNEILEYYVINKKGDLRLVSKENKISFLVIHTDSTLDLFYEVHKDVKWAESFLQKIKKREVIPFFGNDKDPWQVDECEWGNHMFKPEILDGQRVRYYLTLV